MGLGVSLSAAVDNSEGITDVAWPFGVSSHHARGQIIRSQSRALDLLARINCMGKLLCLATLTSLVKWFTTFQAPSLARLGEAFFFKLSAPPYFVARTGENAGKSRQGSRRINNKRAL